MKTNILSSILFLVGTFLITYCTSASGETDTATFKVYGNCEMCKERIEGSLKGVKGVQSAVWDVESKNIKVVYDSKVISANDIQKKVAAVGHDTEKISANAGAYNSLPGCCQYSRKK
jgi:copper chaperone CopZ